MSELLIDNPVVKDQGPNKGQQIQNKEHDHKNNGIDVMALAYYYLIESATTSSETALVQAKRLKVNGLDQRQLNQQAEQLQWNYVPKLKTTHHTKYIVHYHWHFIDKITQTYKKITWVTHKNEALVSKTQEQNEQVAAERQFLTQQISVLQQSASIHMTHVNSISNESTQTMQEGSMIMQILQSLTFKALIRQPARS